ncbi:MAG: hypothetical protein PWP51_936 [Clostridiales bacterium]|nr:hypothetical protein [Clostridiales bacterium]
MFEVKIWGGAGEYGRACFYIESQGVKWLLDCGIIKRGSGVLPELDAEAIRKLDYVFLSHVHEDHSLALPLLYKMGYRGAVYTTEETCAALPHYFSKWLKWLKSQQFPLPYTMADVDCIRYELLSNPMTWTAIGDQMTMCWGRSGHVAGGIWLMFRSADKILFYSGDYSEESETLAFDDPAKMLNETDCVSLGIVDAAYGIQKMSQEEGITNLLNEIDVRTAKGGTILMPVPIQGRGQDLLMILQEHRFKAETMLIVEKHLYDAAVPAPETVYWRKPDYAKRFHAAKEVKTHVVSDEATRCHALRQSGSMAKIIMLPDALLQSQTAQWYCEQLQSASEKVILLTGYQAEERLAHTAQLMKNTGFVMMSTYYKVHQNVNDAERLIHRLRIRQTILFHSEAMAVTAMQLHLAANGYTGADILLP